jgi:hypothetical protein
LLHCHLSVISTHPSVNCVLLWSAASIRNLCAASGSGVENYLYYGIHTSAFHGSDVMGLVSSIIRDLSA